MFQNNEDLNDSIYKQNTVLKRIFLNSVKMHMQENIFIQGNNGISSAAVSEMTTYIYSWVYEF